MNLSKEIVDAIYFHKGVLISELRASDINNTGMISNNEIMLAFIKANIHRELTSQLIMDIINIYLPAKSDKIDYMKLISYFLKDLKILIDNKNKSDNSNTTRSINKTNTDFFKSNTNEVLPKLSKENNYLSSECKLLNIFLLNLFIQKI